MYFDVKVWFYYNLLISLTRPHNYLNNSIHFAENLCATNVETNQKCWKYWTFKNFQFFLGITLNETFVEKNKTAIFTQFLATVSVSLLVSVSIAMTSINWDLFWNSVGLVEKNVFESGVWVRFKIWAAYYYVWLFLNFKVLNYFINYIVILCFVWIKRLFE